MKVNRSIYITYSFYIIIMLHIYMLYHALRRILHSLPPSLSLRVWEKLQARMQAVGATITGVKRIISTWAKSKGLQGNRNLQNRYIRTYM